MRLLKFVSCCFLLATVVISIPAGFAGTPDDKAKKADTQKAKTANSKSLADPSKLQKNGPIELEGEVVDAWCWASGVMGPGRGPEHHKCALRCILGGVSCGIVDDYDNLYIAAKSKAYSGCREQLAPFVSKRVKIKGWVAERGGCRILKITEVEEVGATKKPTIKK